MKESIYQANLIKELKAQGVLVFKIHGNSYQQTGIPDLVCCYHGLFLAIEVKNERGKLSDIQVYRLKEIQDHGGTAEVCKPIEAPLRDVVRELLEKTVTNFQKMPENSLHKH